jgi:hypothetical protein
MKGPSNDFTRGFYIAGILKKIKNKSLVFVMSTRRTGNGFKLTDKLTIATSNDSNEEIGKLENKFPKIKELFPNADFKRGRNPNRSGISFTINDHKDEVLNIIERTRGILGF